ncbi:hypothetical protein SH580_05570 [Coraliomargarita algicola]|uniref:Uncharacterized protein n=1 Tax=Coraliomargarita algicola TaxID=3092156 RepID=A0ABZ0RPX4_9BACT|nr:hypothetical protein [Coraliomargarita sp. J2-16]WPJ97176.1 hypothetical protein SH580_05570 [Coraliomargarita sp. J2-16]
MMKTLVYWALFLCVALSAQATVARILYYNPQQTAPSSIYMYVENQLLGEVNAALDFGDDLDLDTSGEAIEIVFSPTQIAEGATLASGLPTVTVNQDWEKCLIVVVEAAGNERLPVEAYAVNADTHFFGESDFLFINRSPNRLLGTFGETQIEVGAEDLHVVRMAQHRGEFLDVKIDYIRPDDDDKRRWMIQQGWRVLPDRRTVLICYAPAGRTSMKYFAVQIKDL